MKKVFLLALMGMMVMGTQAQRFTDKLTRGLVAVPQGDKTGQDSMIRINAKDYGITNFTIKDGSREYHYSIEIYEDNNGYAQTRIVSK